MKHNGAGLPAVNLLKGIQTVMDQSEMLMMVADTGENSENIFKLTQTFREQQQVKGILIVANHHSEFDLSAIYFEISTVLVNCFDKQQRLPAVVAGDSKGRGVSCNRDSTVEGTPAYRTANSSRHRCSLKTKKNRVSQSAQGTNYNSKSGLNFENGRCR